MDLLFMIYYITKACYNLKKEPEYMYQKEAINRVIQYAKGPEIL
jgi:hypothetical protein